MGLKLPRQDHQFDREVEVVPAIRVVRLAATLNGRETAASFS
jgi:hypothetical protein